MHLIRHVAAVVALASLAGCAPRAVVAPQTDPPDRTIAARCVRAFAALDAAVDVAGVRDVEAVRVPGFPYLRATRFLAAYRDERLDGPAFAQWVSLMNTQDRDARRVEIANLPVDVTRSVQATLAAEGFSGLPPDAFLEGCATALIERDDADATTRDRLVRAIDVPDAYDDTARALGLYAITRVAFAAGVRLYERAVRNAFAERPRPVRGKLVSYAPAEPPLAAREVARRLEASSLNPLGIPIVEGAEIERLFATYAPVFVVDEGDENDRIGRPAWGSDGLPTVTPAPVVFARAAHTRFGGRPHLQLAYTAWFPARRASFPGDPLAGRLDGLVWRVTLDRDGAPLVFDSIHPCGCFHTFIPTARVAAKPAQATLDEQALIPLALPEIAIGERVALHIENATHYLRGVALQPDLPHDVRRFRISHDDVLRTLLYPAGGTRSLFGPDGFIEGTERAERAVLWPLGIARAGAMRQWGRHATAFIGRRHFDDPYLLDRYFLPAR